MTDFFFSSFLIQFLGVFMAFLRLFASIKEKIPCREQKVRNDNAKAIRNLLDFLWVEYMNFLTNTTHLYFMPIVNFFSFFLTVKNHPNILIILK